MNRCAFILANLALVGAIFSPTAVPEVPDTDGNGTSSLVELQEVWPDLTAGGFSDIDTAADGSVDTVELKAALDDGVIASPRNS